MQLSEACRYNSNQSIFDYSLLYVTVESLIGDINIFCNIYTTVTGGRRRLY